VSWLASEASAHVTGRVFEVSGAVLVIAEGWSRGSWAEAVGDASDLGVVLDSLLVRARPNARIAGSVGSAR
jgi:hypothetical protein